MLYSTKFWGTVVLGGSIFFLQNGFWGLLPWYVQQKLEIMFPWVF